MAAIAAMVGSQAASSASNLASSLGTAAIQSETARSVNTQNLNFQQSIVDRGEKSFTDLGLPKAMYWGGQSITSPNTLFHLGGQNFYEGSGVNSNLPVFNSNPYMQFNKAGKPSSIGGTRSTSRPGLGFSEPGNLGSTIPKSLASEATRAGSQYPNFVKGGVYNAVNPGSTYTTVGTNTPTINSRSSFTSMRSDMRDANDFHEAWEFANIPGRLKF